MRNGLAFLMMIFAASSALGDSFDEKLEAGHAALLGGDTAGAMTSYRDLQVDEPESDILYHSIGCAQYKEAEALVDLEATPEDGKAAFETARASFEKVLTSADDEVRRSGEFNYANCQAQLAKQLVLLNDNEATITAFEEAVKSYEDLLRRYPGHEGAQNNLDHMRYFLKSLMQNPPEQQEQQGEGEEEKKDEKDKQEGEEDNQKQEGGENGEGEGENEKQEGQKPEGEQEQQEPKPGEQEEGKEQESQNIEAILQSLEDIDKEEQKKSRQRVQWDGVRKEWW